MILGIRKICREIKRKGKRIAEVWLSYGKKCREVKRIPDNAMIFWGIPEHGNLGDQAITYAQVEFIRKHFRERDIFLVPERKCLKFLYPMKKYAENKRFVFLSHGGGNMGELYEFQEGIRLDLVKHIRQNPIIVFPQTVDYREGSRAAGKAGKIYQKHQNIFLFARERKSFEKMKRLFPACRVGLVPDIVISLNQMDFGEKRKGILFCVRHDKEADAESKRLLSGMEQSIRKKYPEIEIEYTDTYDKDKYAAEYCGQKAQLEDFWRKFSAAELVITDRLHGMIFAAITHTPCVAFNNATGKVLDFYKAWMRETEEDMICGKDLPETEAFVERILSGRTGTFSGTDYQERFWPLLDILQKAAQ